MIVVCSKKRRNINSKIIFPVGDTQEDDGDDQDTLKQTLLDTNPYLLGATIAVSILHSVFEFLAFKNGMYYYYYCS